VEYLELMYWLDRTGYDSWYSIDQYPYREDPSNAVREGLLWIQGLHRLLDKVGRERIAAVIQSGDATASSALMREAFLPV
jgi:hypothetical protein